ncbi:MAG: hypothetical protein P8183_13260 [Anaerolineae bacterium]
MNAFLAVGSNILLLLLLLFLSFTRDPVAVDFAALIPFGILVVFTMFNGIRLASGLVSLLPMVAAATYMVLGALPAAWLFFAAAWFQGVISYFDKRRARSSAADKIE